MADEEIVLQLLDLAKKKKVIFIVDLLFFFFPFQFFLFFIL